VRPPPHTGRRLGIRVSHAQWGEIGRIVLEERQSGGRLISCEVVGDPADPMTARRRELFEPLGREVTRQLEALTGVGESVAPPVRSPEPAGVVESQQLASADLDHRPGVGLRSEDGTSGRRSEGVAAAGADARP